MSSATSIIDLPNILVNHCGLILNMGGGIKAWTFNYQVLYQTIIIIINLKGDLKAGYYRQKSWTLEGNKNCH